VTAFAFTFDNVNLWLPVHISRAVISLDVRWR